MRPLPIQAVADMPDFVRGISVIRGAPVPVVDLRALLEGRETSAPSGRLVTLKVGDRRLAIGVDTVVGLKNLERAQLGELPPLLRDVTDGLIESIGTRDAQFLVVLRASRMLPDDVWASLAASAEEGP
jgi:purine-binding chemotaxis protein CheW